MKNHTSNPLPCIVINRMYTGEYVNHYLGQEVINLYRSDNGKYYLYLNADGQLVNKCCENGVMLMAIPVGNYTIEVLAKVTDLKLADGVLSKQIRYDSKFPNSQQVKYINKKNITYKGVDIIDIFKNNTPQSVYVTFENKNVVFAKPGKRVFIQFEKVTPRYHGPGHYVRFMGIRYPNSSLRNFICPDGGKNLDYDTLMNDVINNHSLWDTNNQNKPSSICPEMEKEFLDRINKLKP